MMETTRHLCSASGLSHRFRPDTKAYKEPVEKGQVFFFFKAVNSSIDHFLNELKKYIILAVFL